MLLLRKIQLIVLGATLLLHSVSGMAQTTRSPKGKGRKSLTRQEILELAKKIKAEHRDEIIESSLEEHNNSLRTLQELIDELSDIELKLQKDRSSQFQTFLRNNQVELSYALVLILAIQNAKLTKSGRLNGGGVITTVLAGLAVKIGDWTSGTISTTLNPQEKNQLIQDLDQSLKELQEMKQKFLVEKQQFCEKWSREDFDLEDLCSAV